MQYAIHAGVKPANLGIIEAAARSVGLDPIEDGDGWNTWGEAPGTDINDADTLHVLAYVDTLGTAIDFALTAAREYREYLVASNGAPADAPYAAAQNGNLVIVSQREDWAEQFLVISTDRTETIANVHVLDGTA